MLLRIFSECFYSRPEESLCMFRGFRPGVWQVILPGFIQASLNRLNPPQTWSSLEKYFVGISPSRVSYDSKSRCQTYHTVEHAALEETVLRSSKSVLHSCSFFNFVVLVVTRLETVEWSQDKETPITVHLSRFHCAIKITEQISCPFKLTALTESKATESFFLLLHFGFSRHSEICIQTLIITLINSAFNFNYTVTRKLTFWK